MKDKVIEIISEVLEEKVTLTSDKNTVMNWDSLNHIRVILELKEKFNVDIPFDDMDKLVSVSAIVNYLDKKIND